MERMLNARIAKRTNMQLKSLSTNMTDIKASADQILAHVTKLERAEHPEATDFIEDRGADKIVKVRVSCHTVLAVCLYQIVG